MSVSRVFLLPTDVCMYVRFLCPWFVLCLCPDANTSQWRVQVDLTVDASQATNMLIVLSVPELDSQQMFQTRFLPGKTKTNLTLNIRTVILFSGCTNRWFVWREHACSSPVRLFSSTRIVQ